MRPQWLQQPHPHRCTGCLQPGQLGDGELLQLNEGRAHGQEGVPQQGAGSRRRVRLHLALLQPNARHSTLGYVSPIQSEQAQEA